MSVSRYVSAFTRFPYSHSKEKCTFYEIYYDLSVVECVLLSNQSFILNRSARVGLLQLYLYEASLIDNGQIIVYFIECIFFFRMTVSKTGKCTYICRKKDI